MSSSQPRPLRAKPFQIDSYSRVYQYPQVLAPGEHAEAEDDGGLVLLPARSRNLLLGAMCEVCRVTAGTVRVEAEDGALINGQSFVEVAAQWELYQFYWRGSEWGMR